MGVLATQTLMLVSAAAATVCQAQVLKDWNHFPQTPLNPILFADSSTTPHISPATNELPKNNSQEYYVYASRDFARGRGISIMTKPDRMKHFHNLSPPVPGVNDMSSAPFEEYEIPGKGRGLIANKMLHKGDRIFAHTPILLLDADVFEESEDLWVTLEQEAVEKLPLESQKKFWALYGQPVQNPVSGRIDPNAFELEFNDAVYYGVFPEIAVSLAPTITTLGHSHDHILTVSQRLNHDCRPNAAYFFDENTLTHYVHAITDITPGTEISITYIDPHMRRRKRVKKLLSNWGFNCSCSACTLSSQLSRASDQRLAQITELSERFDEDGWETASSQMAEALVGLYAQERLHASGSEGYRYAALTHCAEGKYWETVKYAHLAAEMGTLDDGFDDVDALAMKQLAKEPEKAECWMQRLK